MLPSRREGQPPVTLSQSLPMRRILILGCWLSGVCGAFAQDHLVRETGPLSPEDELAALTVPEGFAISLFAAEPMIGKPINLATDEKGRLWVSSTIEYPYAAAKERWSDPQGTRVRDSRDAIKILEDTDGDGRADRVTDFADGLNIPTGVLPWHRPEHHDGCIAWSIPNLWYFADTDGDGTADLREVIFGPLGYEKDTHGMVSSLRLGADGWVYATHGFNNTSMILAKDGSELELHSGNVFRFRPDGSRVEIWSRGQVNPFGLAFDRRGNLYSADCHSAPVYQLIGGAVYPSFGKPHDGLGFGPAMIEHTHGSTGIAGIVFVDRGIWGAEWEDHILIGNPVTSRVNLDRIHFAGTTPRAEEKPDFITSSDPWFRPVDLHLAADGALYVADFYNRIIGHYEVPLDHPGRDRERGRIWRVVKKEGAGKRTSPETFTLSDPVVALSSADPWARRRAAEALIETPAVGAVAALRTALAATPDEDTHLRHTLRVALKQCLSLPNALSQVDAKDDADLASIALAVPTAEAAGWLLTSKGAPDGVADWASLRRSHLAKHGSPEVIAALLAEEIALSANRERSDDASVFLGIAEALEEKEGLVRDPTLLGQLDRLARAFLEDRAKAGPPVWTGAAGKAIWQTQPRPGPGGDEIEVLSSLAQGTKGAEQATGTLQSRPFPMPERLAFALCGHRGPPGKTAHESNHVRLIEVAGGAELARAYPPRNDRAVLVEWRLPEAAGREVRLEVVDGDAGTAFAWLAIGAIEGTDLPVADFKRAAEGEASLRRLARLLVATAPVDLRDHLKPYLPTPPPAPPLEITAEERARLDGIIAARIDEHDPARVDRERGRLLFTTHCGVCHRIGGEGGLVGPQLDGVGSRGLARLAEDILDPNRNVDAHFRLTALKKSDGSVVAGFVVGESGEVVSLLDATGQTHRFLKSEIAGREVSAISLMPAIFGEVLSPADFRDLVGWLMAP
jgi:putative heme-binding domain-containing protein